MANTCSDILARGRLASGTNLRHPTGRQGELSMPRKLRPIAEPFVVNGLTGARIRTRLRTSPEDEAVLMALGAHLGSRWARTWRSGAGRDGSTHANRAPPVPSATALPPGSRRLVGPAPSPVPRRTPGRPAGATWAPGPQACKQESLPSSNDSGLGLGAAGEGSEAMPAAPSASTSSAGSRSCKPGSRSSRHACPKPGCRFAGVGGDLRRPATTWRRRA